MVQQMGPAFDIFKVSAGNLENHIYHKSIEKFNRQLRKVTISDEDLE